MAQKRVYANPKDPRRTHPSVRDALRRRVFNTCGGVCAICHRPLDVMLPSGEDLSPELDEIIPVARGGDPYDIDNLQAVHRICNRRKGSKMAGDDLPADVNPIPNSRAW